MLLTDTDILIYKIEAENVYEDFYIIMKIKTYLTSVIDSKYYNNGNNLVIGKMKDGTCDEPIKGFVGLNCISS